MSKSIFGRFKKNKEPVFEEEPSVWEDRIFWVDTMQKITYPVLSNLRKGSLRKNMPYISKSSEGQKTASFEAFSRVFNGIAPWLELGRDNTDEGRLREKYIGMTFKALENAINPNSEDYMFVDGNNKKILSETAIFAQGLLRSKNQIWLNLPIDVQARIIIELKNTRNIAPYDNHWLLFTSIIEATLLEFTGECDMERLRYGVRKFWKEWYLGDAIYSNGDEARQDYYNSLIIHPMLNDILMVMRKYNIEGNDFLNKQLMRTSRLASQLERSISPEGTYPLVGKSLSYRTGIFHALTQASLFKILPKNIAPAQVRTALTAVLKSHFAGNHNFDGNGWLTVGINGNQLDASEKSINSGSVYLCCEVFLPLGLSFNDPFWSDPFEEWSSLKAWNGHSIDVDQPIDF